MFKSKCCCGIPLSCLGTDWDTQRIKQPIERLMSRKAHQNKNQGEIKYTHLASIILGAFWITHSPCADGAAINVLVYKDWCYEFDPHWCTSNAHCGQPLIKRWQNSSSLPERLHYTNYPLKMSIDKRFPLCAW